MAESLENHPLKRFRGFLIKRQKLWTLAREKEFIEQERATIIQTLKECEVIKKPSRKCLQMSMKPCHGI
jgi:hypothetical protein